MLLDGAKDFLHGDTCLLCFNYMIPIYYETLNKKIAMDYSWQFS
jgi:hypothetical protein